MPHRFFTLVLVLLANSSSAQDDLLACVDPDVRESLLFGGIGTSTLFSRTVPDIVSLSDSGYRTTFRASSRESE